MPDEKYDIQVNFFTKDNVASLEQFRDNISKLGANIQRQRSATGGGGAGILGSILMGGLLGRLTSRLGAMTNEMRRHRGARENNIRIRKQQREYGKEYEKTLESENEALRDRIEKETQDALRQGRAEGIQEAQKRAFGRLEKRTLESAQTRGGLQFTTSAKESRQKIIQANMEAKAYKERNSQLSMELKQANENYKNSNMMREALVDQNKTLTDSMKKVTTDISYIENKAKNSNIIKFPDIRKSKPVKEEAPLIAAQEVKEIKPEVIPKTVPTSSTAKLLSEGMLYPPTPVLQKSTRNPISVERGQKKKHREEKSEEDIQNDLYKLRRNEQSQEGVQ